MNLNVLKNLCLTPGISGAELQCGIVERIYTTVKGINPNTLMDCNDNVISVIGKGPKRILIDSHLDEVGFKIKNRLNDQQFIIETIGKIQTKNIPRFLCGINLEKVGPIFIKKQKIILSKYKDLILKNGSYLTFPRVFRQNGNLIKATALDNRVGCFIQIELIKYFYKKPPKDSTLIFVFSSKEEIDDTNLLDIAKNYNINFSIIIDAAYAVPWNSSSKHSLIPLLGKGVAIQTRGEGFYGKANTIEELKILANRLHLPYQLEQPSTDEGRTNCKYLYPFKIPGCVINIPVRNQHTFSSTLNLKDLDAGIKFLKTLIKNLKTNED